MIDARVRLVLSVTLETKARFRTNVPPDPDRSIRPDVLKIIYLGGTCLVHAHLTKMPVLCQFACRRSLTDRQRSASRP
ncbi:hypothetical protein GCM10017667_22850 [Streptomyces filamentosus]|uniref:Uncharacterized protein n=1 Tax=Streptomyces filamentosus TaxID=67294 RepID=A0A919ELR9_STRFL|nr:hypothetical protein GCM10017667_22850 [Streptomyces filamentosus]